jgi:hypothetical protein
MLFFTGNIIHILDRIWPDTVFLHFFASNLAGYVKYNWIFIPHRYRNIIFKKICKQCKKGYFSCYRMMYGFNTSSVLFPVPLHHDAFQKGMQPETKLLLLPVPAWICKLKYTSRQNKKYELSAVTGLGLSCVYCIYSTGESQIIPFLCTPSSPPPLSCAHLLSAPYMTRSR